MKSSELEMLGIICEIEQAERKAGVTHFLFPQEGGYQEIYKTYVSVRFLLHRLEFGMPSEDYRELIHAVESGNISVEALIIMILHGVLNKRYVVETLESWKLPDVKSAERLRIFHEKVLERNLDVMISYSKRAKMELEKHSKEEQ